MNEDKAQYIVLFDTVRESIERAKKKDLEAYLVNTEALEALLDAGPEVWTAYDPELKTKKAVCASLGLSITNVLNDISLVKRFGDIIRKYNLPVNKSQLRRINRLRDRSQDEELFHSAANMSHKEFNKLMDEKLGKKEMVCECKERESWTKCKKCHKWEEMK